MSMQEESMEAVEISSTHIVYLEFEGEERYSFFNVRGRSKFGMIYNLKRLLHFLEHGSAEGHR